MALRKAVGRPRKLKRPLRSLEERNALVVAHVDLVAKVAKRMKRRLPGHIMTDDLVSAGHLGLIEAAERFDPSLGDSFPKFAEARIKGAMVDDIRRLDTLSRDMRLLAKKMRKAERDEQHLRGRRPTYEEMASRLGVSLRRLWRMYANLTGSQVVGFDDMGQSFIDHVADERADDPEQRAISRDEARRIRWAIRRFLTPREIEVMRTSLSRGLVAAGKEHGVTESRACQIRAEAIGKLIEALNPSPSLSPQPERRTRRIRAGC